MSYPNSGKLSNNRYKDGDARKPDMIGEIVMQRSALKSLLEEHDGDEIVIKLSAWNRSGQYGNFLSVSWNNYKKKEDAPLPKQQALPADDQDVPF
jgi:hypothetical protein